MHKTTLYLDERIYRMIRQRAEARRTTQAAVIREALEAHLAGGAGRRPRSIGMGAATSDLSERAEELLAGMGEDR